MLSSLALMRRSLLLPLLFSFLVIAILVAAGVWTAGRLERSLEDDLGRRLATAAAAAADALDPTAVVELAVDGPEGLAYGRLLVELESLRRAAQASNLFLVDRNGVVLLDLLHPDAVGQVTPLFATEPIAATKALAGEPATTELYRTESFYFKTGFAPVRSGASEVVAVLGVEAGAAFFDVLRETRRNLTLTLLLAVAAIVLLSVLFVRHSLRRQQLERDVARAENLAAVGEMTATLAHEVRNPLGIIKRSAERLRRRYQGEESELLDYIAEESDRLAGTVRRYLDFARPAPAGAPGDAEAAIRTTAGLFASESERRAIAIEVEAEGAGPWTTSMGAEEWKQVLLNLLRNSFEAFEDEQGSAPEGAVPVADAGERKRRIGLRLDRTRGSLRLRYTDNGPGMSPETLARALEPFYTTRTQGSGLGLALVDRLVREAGGKVRIASRPGEGTGIEIWLPEGGTRR